MKISILDLSVAQKIPVQNGKSIILRSEVVKLYQRVYGLNADYHIHDWERYYTV